MGKLKIKSDNAYKTKELACHVLILIAGTTDPTNMYDEDKRALSFGPVPKNYWDQKFVDQLKAFDANNNNFAVMSAHGWTGDNRIKNRVIAGEYIVNRLCGEGGQKPYYPMKHKPMYFHLLGHSHGGNVMHEMTKRMHDLGDKWPEKWKIKSMIYLSTPFFNDIHKVIYTEKTFHEDAEIFHAYNDYDLTQRVVADFSLEALAGGVDNIDTRELDISKKELKTLFDAFPIETLTESDGLTGLYMSHVNGLDLYTRTIALFGAIRNIIIEVLKILEELNKEYTYEVDKKIENEKKEKISSKRQLLKNIQHEQIQTILNTFLADIDFMQEELEDTLNIHKIDKDFTKKQYFTDLLRGQFANNFRNLLDINTTDLSSSGNSIWNILSNILKSNIEKFDDTYVDPKTQYEKTPLKDKIESYDVTNLDKYDQSDGSKNYTEFIDELASLEKNFSNPPSINNLSELLFLLIANSDKASGTINELPDTISMIEGKLEWICTGDTDTNLKTIRATLENLLAVFVQRRAGENVGIADERHTLSEAEIVKNEDDDENNDVLRRGSLMYLMKESHSTSRRVFHKKIEEFLTRIGITI